MKQQLSRIHRTWRRLFITLLVNSFCFLNRATLRHPRYRAHWLGARYRPPRPERVYILLTFALAMLSLRPYEYVVWSLVVGGATSCMVAAHAVYRLIPRKTNR